MKIAASIFLGKLANLDPQKLANIKGIGPIVIENIQKFIQSENYSQIFEKLQKLEEQNKGLTINITNLTKSLENNQNEGKIICITGIFSVPRNQIIEKLEQRGHKIANSLTKEVQILIAGDKAGSKLDKAQKMQIKITENWQEFL